MEFSPLAVVFTLFLLTGFGFALRVDLEASASYVVSVSSVQSSTSPIFTSNYNAHLVRPALHVQLQASNDFTFTFSSLKSLSSSSCCFPNALVVIYSGQYDVNDDTDTGTCRAPLATYNNTVNTMINLTKSTKWSLNLLLLHIRVDVLDDDKWSEAKREFKDEGIVLKIGSNKAKFEAVSAYNNSQRISHVISLKLNRKSTSLNQCNEEDITVVIRHIVSCDNKINQKMKKQQVFNWSQWLLIFSLIFLPGLLKYSIRYFIRLRPLFHDYFHFDRGEDDAVDE